MVITWLISGDLFASQFNIHPPCDSNSTPTYTTPNSTDDSSTPTNSTPTDSTPTDIIPNSTEELEHHPVYNSDA